MLRRMIPKSNLRSIHHDTEYLKHAAEGDVRREFTISNGDRRMWRPVAGNPRRIRADSEHTTWILIPLPNRIADGIGPAKHFLNSRDGSGACRTDWALRSLPSDCIPPGLPRRLSV